MLLGGRRIVLRVFMQLLRPVITTFNRQNADMGCRLLAGKKRWLADKTENRIILVNIVDD
jgi:hypothetical protein